MQPSHIDLIAQLLQTFEVRRSPQPGTDYADAQAGAQGRTMQGSLLLNFQLGMRYCMAMASSRAPNPCFK